jgi:pimeloyl-ACP methyl ester carboxylesterase
MKIKPVEIEVEGKIFSYIDAGIGSGTDSEMGKNTLVIIPGFAIRFARIAGIVELLAPHMRVIALELPGKSYIQAGEIDSVEDYCRWLVAGLERIGVRKFALLGHSLGAALTMVILGMFPEKVQKLCLVTPLLKAHKDSLLKSFLKAAVSACQWVIARRSLTAFANLALDMLEFKRSKMLLQLAASIDLERYNFSRNLPVITFLAGKDKVLPVIEQRSLAQKMLTTKVVEYQDAGHSLLFVHTDRLLPELISFLTKE